MAVVKLNVIISPMKYSSILVGAREAQRRDLGSPPPLPREQPRNLSVRSHRCLSTIRYFITFSLMHTNIAESLGVWQSQVHGEVVQCDDGFKFTAH